MLKVTKISAGYNGKDVVSDVAFEVGCGESLAIIGPNGCGKSTLLKAIINILPYAGSVFIDDIDLSTLKFSEISRKIALLGQISSVYFSYTVYDTVLMGRYSHSKGFLSRVSKEDKDFVENCLKTVNLLDVRNRNLNTLSGGQLQRVFLARTLAQDPQIILLDEPTNHLDLRFQIELIDYLCEWVSSKNRSVIGVMHDLSLAMRLSENVLVLKEGKTVALGQASKVLSSKLLHDVYGIDIVYAMKKNLMFWENIIS